MTRAIFLLSKDPVAEHGGDVELSRLVMRLAADTAQVSAICLSHQQPGTVDADLLPGGMALVRVAKAGVQPLRLLSDTVRTGRSLAHARFDNDELVAAKGIYHKLVARQLVKDANVIDQGKSKKKSKKKKD